MAPNGTHDLSDLVDDLLGVARTPPPRISAHPHRTRPRAGSTPSLSPGETDGADDDPDVPDEADIPTIIPSFEYEIPHDAIVRPPWDVPFFRDGVGQSDSEDEEEEPKPRGGRGGTGGGVYGNVRGRSGGGNGNGGTGGDEAMGSRAISTMPNGHPPSQHQHRSLHSHRDQHTHYHQHIHRERAATPLLIDYSPSPGPDMGMGGVSPFGGGGGGGFRDESGTVQYLGPVHNIKVNGLANHGQPTYSSVHNTHNHNHHSHNTNVNLVINNYGTPSKLPPGAQKKVQFTDLIDLPPSPSIESMLKSLDLGSDTVVNRSWGFKQPAPATGRQRSPSPLVNLNPNAGVFTPSSTPTPPAPPTGAPIRHHETDPSSFTNSIPLLLGVGPLPAVPLRLGFGPIHAAPVQNRPHRPPPGPRGSQVGTLVELDLPTRPLSVLNPRVTAYVPSARQTEDLML